jgi:hypothetical protein
MGRSGKITAGQRLTFGFAIAGVAAVLFTSDQPNLAWFTLGAIFLPYLAFIAPIRCGTPRSRDSHPCRNNGHGFLVGCTSHRLDRVRRIFRRAEPLQPRRTTATQSPPVAMSGGIPGPTTGTVSLRRKIFDTVAFVMTTLGTVAGWLALFMSPG